MATVQEEKVARRIFRMTTSGVAFDTLGRSETYDLLRKAAAGIAIIQNIPLEEAQKRLLECSERC